MKRSDKTSAFHKTVSQTFCTKMQCPEKPGLNRQRGFFSVELALVAIGVSAILVMWMTVQSSEMINDKVKRQANYIAQLTNATRSYVSQNHVAILAQPATVTEPNVLFLKGVGCGGTAVVPYLPCNFLETDEFGDTPQTVIGNELLVTGSGSALTAVARTTYSPIIINNKLRLDLSEKLIDHATGVNNPSSAAAALNNFMTLTIDLSNAATGLRGSVYADTTLINPALDIHLRIDGQNAMTGDLDMGGNSLINAKNINGTGDLSMTGKISADVVTASNVTTSAGRSLQKSVIQEDVIALAATALGYSSATISTAGIVCDPGLTLKIFAGIVASGTNSINNAIVTYAVASANQFEIRASIHTDNWVSSDIPAYVNYRLRCL